MAKRRANNEGTIYKMKSGKWRAQIFINYERMGFVANTQKECQEWIKKIRQHIDQGFTFKGSKTKLKLFLNKWLETVRSSRTRKTYELYKWTMEKRVIPALGNYDLLDLNARRIQGFYDNLIRDGQSEMSVRSIHKTLRAALNHGVKLGYIPINPCLNTTPPKPKQNEMKFYDDEQVKKLLNAAIFYGNRLYPFFYLAVHTGMRQAELLGLKWNDLDTERCTLHIRRQVQHFKGGSYSFSPPKSSSGVRTIILGQIAIQVLLDHQIKIKRLKLEAGGNWIENDLIFPSKVGTPLTASNVRRSFRRLITISGLPQIRFHDLRHTAASLMLNNGIPILIASQRLGHSKASITMDVYGHLLPNKQEEAAHLMDNLIS